ncbi:unnamed protein product [Bathycoccus prasinos]
MEEAEARRAVRKALSEARANSLFSSSVSSSSVRGCQKKSEQTLAFAKLTDTLGECLEKMKEKDVLSLPILDLEKKTTKDSFHGNLFCVTSHESSSANPRVMPPMIEELGLQPGDVSRFGGQYSGDVPAKKTREDEEDPIASTFHATVQSVLDRLTANPRSRIVIAKIPRAHRCLVERLDGTSHAKHDVLSCTDIVKYLNENVEVQAALANVCLADVPYLFRKGFTVLKSGEKIYRDETLFVTNNDALRQQSALDFFPDIVGEKVSVCFVTTVPSSFVTPRPRDFTVHVRGDITSSDLRGMNIENLSMLKSDPLSFAATMRRRHHRDQTKADIGVFQSVDPKNTSLKDVMVLFANGCRRVYVVNGDLTGSSGVLDARNFLVGLTLQDEDIECVVSEGSQ